MESTPVNWEALDALLIDFAKFENLIEDSSAPSTSSSSYHSRLLIRQIRHSLETAAIDAALHLLRLHTPSIHSDRKILFRLHKQKFIELLRKGDRGGSRLCYRVSQDGSRSLRARRLSAYEEFKHVLLAFIYDKDDKTSPVANEELRWTGIRLKEFQPSCFEKFLPYISAT